MSNYLEKTISNLISSQFPSFYESEGPVFIEFVKVYYEWMESVSASRENEWISEGVSFLTLESGNTEVIGTNTRLTDYFTDNDRIAISRGTDTNAYDIYTINTVANNTYLTITTNPDFSSEHCKFSTVADTGNPVFMARHFDEIQDIDQTFENFLVYFKEKYLKNLQFINVTNTRRLVKHSLDLYRSKGTERAIELLFRITFGITPSVYYPSHDLFRLSDGHWYVPMYLEVSMNRNTTKFVNKQIYGMKSGATAFVESVVRRTVNDKLIDVVYISSINGPFQTGEPVNTSDNIIDPIDCPIIIGSLTQIVVDARGIGSGFAIGDEVQISSIKGQGGKARVHETTNTSGTITFDFISGGYGYTNSFSMQISDHILTVANVSLSNSDTEYFYPGDEFTQPLGHINYVSGNGVFSNNETIFTYHANNQLKGSGRVLETFPSNSTSGMLIVSVLNGNLESNQFFTTSNTVVANQSSLEGFVDKTATGTVVGVDNRLIVKFTGSNGSFVEGERVYQYNSIGKVTGSGQLRYPATGLSGELIMINAKGVFHNSSPIYNSSNTVAANVISSTVYVGVKLTDVNPYVNTGINYARGSNTSSNGTITFVPGGSGANVIISSNLLYTEEIQVCNDVIGDFLNVALNATTFGMSGNSTANLTNMSIADALGWSTETIGKLSGIVSQASGRDYGDRVMVRVFEEKTMHYALDDTFVLTISGGTSDFEDGELITQSSTGARGILKNHTSDTLTIERLNFYEANTWIQTVNSTSTIMGTFSGSVANVENVELLSPESLNLGDNALFESDVNISNGTISILHVIDSGFGFVDGEQVNITSRDGTVMTGHASLQTHGFGTGFYLSRGGFLSDDQKLFDGDYWQNFSYEVRSSRTLDKYLTMLKEVVHVSGTKIFGAFYHDTNAESNTEIISSITIS